MRDVVPTAQSSMTSAVAEQMKVVAEIQGQIMLARQFPRDVVEATDKILNECMRPAMAEQAVYSYARGGSSISGPSIRLAEVLARHFGNLKTGWKIISETPKSSEIQVYCWDLETNVINEMIITVPKERHTRAGKTLLTDPRDIYENNSNQASRRLRAVILKAVPGDITEAAVKQCDETLKASIDITPGYIKNVLGGFAELGVNRDMIEKKIQRSVEALLPAQAISLRKIYNAIKDGVAVPGDHFDTSESAPAPAADGLLGKMKGVKAAVVETSEPATAPQPAAATTQPAMSADEERSVLRDVVIGKISALPEAQKAKFNSWLKSVHGATSVMKLGLGVLQDVNAELDGLSGGTEDLTMAFDGGDSDSGGRDDY